MKNGLAPNRDLFFFSTEERDRPQITQVLLLKLTMKESEQGLNVTCKVLKKEISYISFINMLLYSQHLFEQNNVKYLVNTFRKQLV